MSVFTIRMATEEDAAALLEVYRPYIATPITFEYEAPSEEEFARRIREVLREYPYLVCEEDGCPIGYAYAHRHKERAAYQWDADLSIYLSEAARGRGAGRALYGALLELLQRQNVRNVYGAITKDNERSLRFHRRMGFAELGVYHSTGYKCGRWLDVCWVEKRLSGQTPPLPVRPLGELPAQEVQGLLRRWTRELCAAQSDQ
ncbi:MAG: GNAT family N-acetyltransferase [Oscillospiraceae bacterium]